MKNLFTIKSSIENMFGKLRKDEKGQSFTELIILICIGVIVAAFVILPQLRIFAQEVMAGLINWWRNTISGKIFLAS